MKDKYLEQINKEKEEIDGFWMFKQFCILAIGMGIFLILLCSGGGGW